MENWHTYYFLTTFIAILIPLGLFLISRQWVSSLFFFPVFYFIYSFVAPLPLIFYDSFDEISRAYYVWDKIFIFFDSKELYYAHTYMFLFYIFWFVGFFLATDFKICIFRNPNNHFKDPGYSINLFIWLPIAFSCLAFYMIFSVFGFNFLAVYGSGTKTLYGVYGTLFWGTVSLWGCSVISLSALVFLRMKNKKGHYKRNFIYIMVNLFLYLIFSIIIGDRSQLFVVLISVLILWNCLYKPIKMNPKTVSYLTLSFVLFTLIKSFRGEAMMQAVTGEYSKITPISLLLTPFTSVESFAAYTAMMFLIIHNTPLLYGQSILAFFISFVPRIIAPFRTPSSFAYTKYVEYANLGGVPQGFTFHLVADLYWNFALLGVIVGGVLFGYLFGKLEKKCLTSTNIFWPIAFATCVGHVPISMRAPVEGLKAIIYEYWFIPFFMFVLLPQFNRLVLQKNENSLLN